MALNVLLRAEDLDRWASRIESRHLFPVLIRRLIYATVRDLRRLEMHGFEGVGTSGWDGIVKTDAVGPHVPEGVSGWEIGTGKDAEKKANREYRKRTDDPLDLVPADSAFVFATPREWGDKQD